MAIHSSVLAWEMPWTEEPGRLPSMGSLSKSARIVICVVHFSRVHPQSSSSLLSVTLGSSRRNPLAAVVRTQTGEGGTSSAVSQMRKGERRAVLPAPCC